MKLSDNNGFIWLDGDFVTWNEAKVHTLTHSLHYGSGIFEGVRAYLAEQGTAIFRLDDHTERLFHSAEILNMLIPYSKTAINQAQIDVIRRNKLQEAYIRPVVFYGAEHLNVCPSHLSVHVSIAAWAWSDYFKVNAQEGINACISHFTRARSDGGLFKAKASGHYLKGGLALKAAKEQGFEESILMDDQGYVSEGSSSNLFTVKGNVLYTPCTDTILEGITRDTVITLARECDIKVIEKNLTCEDLYSADEMFLTGTASEITPVIKIDDTKIGEGQKGPVTDHLQQRYAEVVRGKGEHPNYLTYCLF